MLVNRWIYTVKEGRKADVVALHKAEREHIDVPMRIYTPLIGSNYNVLIIELEFESLRHYEKSWEEWSVSRAAEVGEKMTALVEYDNRQEIWLLEE